LLFLFLLFIGCDAFQSAVPIKLTFQQLSEREKERFISDSLFSDYGKYDILAVGIQNRDYDSLFMAAYRFDNSLFFVPNGYKVYHIENDSLILFKHHSPTHCGIDTVICLLRNQSANLIFEGHCTDQQTAYEYDFQFMADSAGQRIFPQFWRFPCGNGLSK